MLKRYIEESVFEDLKEKMVFISGPRQIGKTTLAKQIAEEYFKGASDYLNWDNRQDRKSILSGAFNAEKKFFIFDEIHKYKNWKNFLKGEYDKYKDTVKFLVTGSAKLDIYKKGGDSLLGRYHAYRLHPLSLGELTENKSLPVPFKGIEFPASAQSNGKLLESLLEFGGFPEIFLKHSHKELRRWHNERSDRLIKEDIRDLENIRDISSLQVLADLLPDKVGSLFSMNSLREDLGVTHKTIASWVDIFERFYYHFRIYPYQSTIIKSLRKEPKLYLWDWSEVEDENARFENLVACALLKFCHYFFDSQGYKTRLHYIRDKAQKEVDFLVCVDNKPWFCVEVKNSSREISPSLRYFKEKLKIPFSYEVVKESGVDRISDNIRLISASKFLSALI